ncbi:hypothetical protein NHQ30_008331 [Ciborinia camelliae]|nr:hypothetical protein NHQ30_008331 [Ciborinia camelliae]
MEWLYNKPWISSLYHETLIVGTMSIFEEEGRAKIVDETQKRAEDKSIFDPEGNPKPEHKEITYPSGDDLGVDWFATPRERKKMKLVRKSWEDQQNELRDIRWLWYLWNHNALTKGWKEQPNEFGDRARNEKDAGEQIKRLGNGNRVRLRHVHFNDMKESLDGTNMGEFKWRWQMRHIHESGPCWEV